MENEQIENKNTSVENNYLEVIQKLKENSVDKAEYEKLVEENKKLLNTIIEQKPSNNPVEDSKVEKLDIKQLRNELFNSELNNLQYIDKTLQLRKALIDAGEPDPFIPSGSKYSPTNEDIDAANRVAEGLQHCVDYANEYGGDSEVFTNELQRITIDIPMPKKRY